MPPPPHPNLPARHPPPNARAQVLTIGATNLASDLDQALLRPGRFELVYEIPNPGPVARLEILKYHARGKPLESEGLLKSVAEATQARAEPAAGRGRPGRGLEGGLFASAPQRTRVLPLSQQPRRPLPASLSSLLSFCAPLTATSNPKLKTEIRKTR